MPTLANFRAQLERNLMDTTNLIWSQAILEEAIRASLADISRAYDEKLTINQLDSEVETTVDPLDFYLLIKGAVAYALIFRTVGRFEEATPEPSLTPHLATVAEQRMKEFKYYLIPIYAEHGTFIGDEEYYLWQSAENALDRALKVSEAALDRALKSSEANLDRAARADLQDELLFWREAQAVLDRAHKVSEAALNRTHQVDILQMQYDREDALDALENARLQQLQESDESPWSDWKWEEKRKFS